MALTSGLGLISTYDNSDDEEDINEEILKSKKGSPNSFTEALIPDSNRTTRLPLPSSITQLYNDEYDINKGPEDNPEKHEGRVRSFPHQRGNWSTYVYLPYEPEEEFLVLVESLQASAAKAGIQLQAVSDLHISLTRTVVLLHHWIENFVSSVKKKLSHLPRFQVVLGPPDVYCNEERTRTFLGLRVMVGSNQLIEASQALDECLAEFRLPSFYKNPSFHMSVLWAVGDKKDALEKLLPTLHSEFFAHSLELKTTVSHCLCKTGNKMFTFPLASL